MPTLKEIKGRIASVQNTLKITSAMKLVSSAKLRKAQAAIEAMRPYQEKLDNMLALAGGTAEVAQVDLESKPSGRTVILAFSSNSSLCGGFNSAAIGKLKEVLEARPSAGVITIGRKIADAMRKAGRRLPIYADLDADALNHLSEHPAYAPVSALAEALMDDSSVEEVLLVYNHFVSTGKQVPVVELLYEISPLAPLGRNDNHSSVIPSAVEESDAILEPSRKDLLEALYPKSVKVKLYSALLDSATAEHAARTVAMQAATDNGEDLLQELTLQYNKGRQQKITNEILDLAGGAQS